MTQQVPYSRRRADTPSTSLFVCACSLTSDIVGNSFRNTNFNYYKVLHRVFSFRNLKVFLQFIEDAKHDYASASVFNCDCRRCHGLKRNTTILCHYKNYYLTTVLRLRCCRNNLSVISRIVIRSITTYYFILRSFSTYNHTPSITIFSKTKTWKLRTFCILTIII